MAVAEINLSRSPDNAQVSATWWRLGLGALLAGQGMLLGLAVNLSDANPRERLVLHLVVGASALGVVFLLGWPLLQSALRAAAERKVSVEMLFLTAIAGAFAASVQSTIANQGAIYFEVVSILLVVYSISKTLLAQQRASAIEATRGWTNRLRTARLCHGEGRTRCVPAKLIQPGDVVEVQPGEWAPIDGVLVRGAAFVRDTPLTGEPFARVLRVGDSVSAGSAVEDATLWIRATRRGDQRRIDELLATVEQARGTTCSLQRHADRLTTWFLPTVWAVALATFVVWTTILGWQTGLLNAMSVLLVACPCALGLATPLAVWSTLSLLAARGFVVRDPDAIESLATVNHVVFDKTGTLTDDALFVVDVTTRTQGSARARVLSWIAAVESRSGHPVAKALAGIPAADVEHPISDVRLRVRAGQGIEACFLDQEGVPHEMKIGRPEWIADITPDDESPDDVSPDDVSPDDVSPDDVSPDDESPDDGELRLDHAIADTADSRIDVALDGRREAIGCLREKVRETAWSAIAELRRRGVRVSVLTGDRPKRAVAAGLDDAIGDLLPAEKARVIDDWQSRGARCLYVGDGINDAPALCAAHVGVALQAGAELASAAASATLCHDNLTTIVYATDACRRAVRTLKLNLFWAASYNAVGMGLAASGWLHPVAAAFLMVGSSLLVAFRSLRLHESDA